MEMAAILKRIFDPFTVVTGAKSFQNNSFIGNAWLNRQGLHKKRFILAHKLAEQRLAILKSRLLNDNATPRTKAAIAQFEAEGCCVIENFLSAASFKTLRNALNYCKVHIWQCIQGDTYTRRLPLTAELIKRNPVLSEITDHPELRRLFRICGSGNRSPLMFFESIHNGVKPSKGSSETNINSDPQKNLHSDTFQPTVKGWLYLEDVHMENGPFHFVKGSHKATEKRAQWEYEMSLKASGNNDSYTQKGSFRISREELAALDLPEPTTFTVPANTLVMADTSGFHSRGQAKSGTMRRSFYFSDRGTPFLPFPMPFIPRFGEIKAAINLKMLEAEWKTKSRKGRKASWAPVDFSEWHGEDLGNFQGR